MSDSHWDAINYAMRMLNIMIPNEVTPPITVFYGDQLYASGVAWKEVSELPDGVILYIKAKADSTYWYRKDFTPMLVEDVPQSNKTWILLMGV